MTLIVAADVQDHLILAGDHCAVLTYASNGGAQDLVLDQHRKVLPWKYGAIAASGDVLLTAYFSRLLMARDGLGEPIDLREVARDAKAIRTRAGIPPHRSTGNIFLTLPGADGFNLHGVFVKETSISHEIVEPIGTCLSMRHGHQDAAACEAFTRRLRPSFFFEHREAFERYHLRLLDALFADWSASDALVTSTFDAFILEKRTGAGVFWPGAARDRERHTCLPDG